MKISVMRALVVALLFLAVPVLAQKKLPTDRILSVKAPSGSVCYAAKGDVHVFIPPPGTSLKGGRAQAVDTTAIITVSYTGFSPQAKKAFQYAVNIWRTQIISQDTIHVQATWEKLGTNVLGSASPAAYYANFNGAQKLGVYYPVALAEKVAHRQLNPSSEPDIVASFNSSYNNWYYGTDGNTPAGKYDLVSVILHEIGHGLGIFGFYSVSGSTATFTYGVPGVFDTNMETQVGVNIVSTNADGSTAAATIFKSDALFYKSPLELASNLQKHAKLYAPGTFSAGSSIYHLDENTYPAGDKNSLMTPQFNSAEAIHNPGPIVRGMLKDMGWNDLDFQHTPLPNTEATDTDFSVNGTVLHDTTYDHSSVKVFYSTGTTTFTPVAMAGSGDQYSATIPKPASPGSATKYSYYFSATDVAGRSFTFPGQIWQAGVHTQTQRYFQFTAGPDTHAPIITHTPTGFLKNTASSLTLDAVITDDIGVQSAVVNYLINDVAQSDASMVLKSTIDPSVTDSTYTVTIPMPALSDGDVIKYRIVATDISVAHNTAAKPITGYYSVNVVSLAATQNSYGNDFNSASTDFFGDNLFGISTATGFTDGAINTTHPYPISDPKDSISYTFQLRIPIRINANNPIIRFDEIVLVEPNDAGASFGGQGFYDYVVTEGSSDGGVTWKPFLTGYNCRAKAAWLTQWNSSNDGSKYPNSTGVGKPSLYGSRSINMLANGKFEAGEEVVIRFRLLSDQLSSGWGWAIDNLKIQIDDAPPAILHNQIDFLAADATSVGVATKVTDASGVKSIAVEYSINNGSVTSIPFTLVAGIDQYTLTLDVTQAGLKTGDEIEYRIVASDSVGNSGSLPATGFMKVAILDFSTPVNSYFSDFNSANSDFAGNFFSIATPGGFADGAIHSDHPYLVGFGLDNTSSTQYMLKKPVTVSATNPLIYFNEIAVVETNKDYVVVEGSKDNGLTWIKLLPVYNAKAYTVWQNAYINNTDPLPSLFKGRLIDITSTGDFAAGDNVLIRFRLYSDATSNAWGWAIDNLSIQTAVTGLENPALSDITVYPNPVNAGYMTLQVPSSVRDGAISLISIQGQSLISTPLHPASDGKQKIYVGDLADGLYLVKIKSAQGQVTRKVIVKKE